MADKQYTAADMVIDTFKNNGIEYVFGIPGAKLIIYSMHWKTTDQNLL